jgi:hypothetical protein
MPSGDIKEFFCVLWLVTAELVYQGWVVCARPECQDDINAANLGELVTLSGEVPDVIPQGFPLLLPATLQILGIVEPHACALKVAGDDLLEILPIIDWVFGQVIESISGHVGQVDGEELDDEELIVRPACPARYVVVLQPDTGIGLAVILDDVVGHMETPREAHIVHVAPECFRSKPLRATTVPFPMAAPVMT